MITSATFLFDGECAFCRASADVLRDRVAPRGVRVLPFQRADLARYGVTAEQCRRAAALVGLDGGGAALPPLFGAAAIARALRRGDGVYAYQLAVVTPRTLIRQIATDRNRSLARATLQGIQHFLCRSSKQYTPQYP